MTGNNMQEIVQKYYAKTLTGSQDLQTNACCTDAGLPHFVKPLLTKVHAEIQTHYYGYGMGISFNDTLTDKQKSGCC